MFITAGTKINDLERQKDFSADEDRRSGSARKQAVYLDAAAPLLLEQDVLGLQVTVDDAVLVKRVETLQDGVGELPDQQEAEALELVLFDELVQVHAEQFKGHADVVAEREVLQHVDHVHARVLVLLPQVLQDADLFRRLPVEALLVANHFQRHVVVTLVIEGFHHLQNHNELADLPSSKAASHIY